MGSGVAVQAVPSGEVRSRAHRSLNFDAWLGGSALILLAFGLVMLASASITTAERNFGTPLHYFWKQLGHVLLGVVLAIGVIRVPLHVWRRVGTVLFLVVLTLLALVLVPGIGREVNGSMRWVAIGPISLQPSEFMKLFVIVYLAGYLVRRGDEVRTHLKGFLKPIFVLGISASLLLMEPDYGAAVVLFVTALGMLFLAGVPLRIFGGWVCVIGIAFAGTIFAAPYRLERLTTFLNPWADPFNSGFQLTQALIAIGRGDWFGVGLGSSVQKLFYLPEAHTDFLFAVLAEELGMAGMAMVIGLFAVVVWRAFDMAKRAEHQERYFAGYLAYGLGLLIGLQAFLNIGVNMGALPTKGLALPFMSYGGSSVIASCLAVGLLLRIDRELRTPA